MKRHSDAQWLYSPLYDRGTVTFHLTTVVCSEQPSAVLSIYSNSGIYILELYTHARIDNLYLNP